ncbi:MAG: hypothetical protein U0821_03075 [Chloroflexota bacterium]
MVITSLLGIICGCAFFLVGARSPWSLGAYLVAAVIGATAAHLSGLIPPGEPPLSLGDVHLMSAMLGSWLSLITIRAFGL